MQQDKIVSWGKGSVIQHGDKNSRVYLMKLKDEDFPEIIDHINNLARENNYTKIFCKIPSWASPAFISNGFVVEAQIPKCFHNRLDAFFVSKFLDSDRLMRLKHSKLDELAHLLREAPQPKPAPTVKPGFVMKNLSAENCQEIAALYRQVFDSYPFPIYDPEYIRQSCENDVQYFGIEYEGRLAGLSSAEIDRERGNAEMTDFATLPAFRGNQIAILLLRDMEKSMKKQGISTVYTICRLNSIPINKTFIRMNYKYGGTLIKNTHIAGDIESMNVFYKHI